MEGIAVDLIQAAFKAEGVDVKFISMNYDRGMAMVKDGKAIGCFDAPRTKEIEDVYLWHDERLFPAESLIYSTADFSGTIKNASDLEGKKLGLTQGYGYGDSIDLNEKIDKLYSKSDEIILKKLSAKRVDFVIVFGKVADYLIGKLGIADKVKSVGSSETTDIYLAFSKTHPEGKKWRDLFSAGFAKIKGDGTYDKIMKDWDEKLKGSK